MDGNLLLARLPVRDQKRLAPYLETVALPERQRLFEAGDTVGHAWFPTRGLISLRGVSIDGGSIEFAMIAADGVVGLPLICRGAIAPHVAVVQIAGAAVRMDARTLECETRKSAVLHDALLYYSHGVLAAASQAALCHSFHNVLQRLCRWLLAATDRLHTDSLDVTHEALSDVLGAPRRAVSAAALELQDGDAIRYRYGRIVILNRPRLERSACECYEALRGDGRPPSPGPEQAVGSVR